MASEDSAADGHGQAIVHLFADYGAESEALSTYGDVYRYTIDPEPNPFCERTVQMDLLKETPSIEAKLVVAHPSCAPWADTTHISGDRADHENQIPRARELAQEIGEHYIIENKPAAPLKNPTVLNGRMFGLPLAYERAFETSFRVPTPPIERTLNEKTVTPYFYADRSKDWWQAVKGLRGQYPKEHVAKNALPLAYVDHLCRAWLEATNPRDAETPQDNNSPAPREVTEDQATLMEVQHGE